METLPLSLLMQSLKYTFHEEPLLQLALTHKSYPNENPGHDAGHNERLEFLGDAVLDFVISDHLMRCHPTLPEGDLSKMRAMLVSEAALAVIARTLNLGAYLRMGKGEKRSGGEEKDSLLSDALEALIAAIYLDSVAAHEEGEPGLGEIQRVVLHLFGDSLEQAAEPGRLEDYKTVLQEWVQARHKDTVRYEILGAAGPDHDKTFEAAVFLETRELGRGRGHSKKSAEQEAARQALEKIAKDTP